MTQIIITLMGLGLIIIGMTLIYISYKLKDTQEKSGRSKTLGSYINEFFIFCPDNHKKLRCENGNNR